MLFRHSFHIFFLNVDSIDIFLSWLQGESGRRYRFWQTLWQTCNHVWCSFPVYTEQVRCYYLIIFLFILFFNWPGLYIHFRCSTVCIFIIQLNMLNLEEMHTFIYSCAETSIQEHAYVLILRPVVWMLLQNITSKARVFTRDLPNKRRRFFDFWCSGTF